MQLTLLCLACAFLGGALGVNDWMEARPVAPALLGLGLLLLALSAWAKRKGA